MNKQCLYDLCLKVSDLILTTGCWKSGLLRELFPPADVVRRESMEIGNIPDKNIWSYTKHGAYTVKSGYWFVANHIGLWLLILPRVWQISILPSARWSFMAS
ncbi:unnamed protein product [Microthlaspi erraticum]|uniref:Uncharacterized protein n=1 Tax=Microthlaspi erraticum TaxID=1685480 RepID=A0A6D2K299_9BRAS|nr:unnamed protein product [Microthlaspi erraticum]